ncbi:MAG: 3-deoxy-8-phosphooctulonate synthase [Ignavibacteriales bacterium]|nr:MAG: 3-deoxy-8-phosphooctulonate synthase [Ignavibacteriales bacterium]
MNLDINGIIIGDKKPFVLIAGPCVVESEELTIGIAKTVKEITARLNIPYIFKASYRKANRTSAASFTGIGDDNALNILSRIKRELNLPVLTDVHSPEEAKTAADFVDILQIPAFLCRQTELLVAAGSTGKVVNIKKGQFLAPEDMSHAAAKVESTGNKKMLLTERGTTFGYHNLVVDMRSLVIMKELGYPVVMDATHSVQLPSKDNTSGGQPKFIKPLARAAAAVGIDALFLEVHPDPSKALSDASSQLKLSELEDLLKEISLIDRAVKNY